MSIIDSLVPALSPDRAATLAPLQARVDAAHTALMAVRDEHGPAVERLARVDLVRLQSRVKPEFYATIGVVRTAAIELRTAFDHADVPVDLRAAFRSAQRPTSSAADFTSTVRAIQRDADRYCGGVEYVGVLVRRLVAGLVVLADAPTIFSDKFEVPPRQEFGYTAVMKK